MTHTKTLLTAIIAASAILDASPAFAAGNWSDSGAYNGGGSAQQNTPSNFALRDSNNNLTMVNGQFTSGSFSQQSGAQNASAGVGTGGAGSSYGQASAIGNSLNVVTVGMNNTVIVDSRQTNTGNQTASVDLNSH